MIVCDYIDDRVKNYLNVNKSKKTILTFFKEPFGNYKENKVIFIDDILNEENYREIDIFVNKVMKDAEEVFSKYLKIDGYELFDYLKSTTYQSLTKIYKYKYCVDKLEKGKCKTNIYYFSSELEVLEWLKQDHLIHIMSDNESKKKLNIKSKIGRWAKNSNFVNYIFDNTILRLFMDKQGKRGNILWLGGRLINSKLIPELQKENRIFLLQQGVYKLSFIKRKNKFNLLKLKSNKKYFKRWKYIKSKYKQGLDKISHIIKLRPNLLEIILKIDESIIYDLLLTLSILEDNKNNIDLLIVEQSVIGKQALAVEYFYKNNLPSVEILHGVPSAFAIGEIAKAAVYGQRDKLFLSNHGLDKSKIVITGCPYYDRIFNIKKEEKKYDFLLLILTWIQYLSSSNSHEKIFKLVVIMLKLLQEFQEEKLVIKLHPTQSKKEVEYINHLVKNIMHIEKRVEIVKNVDIFNLLKDAKIVYNHCSSTGVEALLMKKPLIILDLFSHRSIDYEKFKGCLVAKNYRELVLTTEEILKDVYGYSKKNNENIEKTRRYFSGDLKGESYKNVAKLINRTIYK